MVRGMAVILDVLALLPHTEVVESGGSVEADSGPFLFRGKELGYLRLNLTLRDIPFFWNNHRHILLLSNNFSFKKSRHNRGLS